MNKQNIRFITLMLGLNLLVQVFSFAQEQIPIVVHDESGNPVVGAEVIIGEDGKAVFTNEKGEFLMPSGKDLPVYIEAEGFESQLIHLSGSRSIGLKKTLLQMGEQDNIYIPFGKLKKRQMAGAVTAIDPKKILLYDEQKSVTGILNGRITGLFGSSNIRGFGDALFVINGVPRQGIDINPHEIDQISVVKDLSTSMLYGSQATDGVILITTRRGSSLKKELNFIAESGINKPILYPSYLPAADYMELYNEALENDGFAAKYTQIQIDSTRSGLNTVRFPNVEYYNSTYLKDFSTYRNFIGEVIRGNETGKFYLNVGWNHSDGLLKIGSGANEMRDRLNIRTNIDFRVSDIIDLVFDASVIFNISKAPRYSTGNDFWNLSSTYKPDIFPTLIPYTLIMDKEMLQSAKLVDNKYVLGGTSEYLTSIYGDLYFNGDRRSYDRLIELNTGLNFDLNSITKGLNAKTQLLFDMYNNFIEDILNSYAVYRPNYTGDILSSFTKLGTDIKVVTRTLSDAYFYRKYGFFGTLDYDRKIGDHTITATGLAYIDDYTYEALSQPLKHARIGLRANYMFMNKYIAELTGVYAISGKLLSTDNPRSVSPGIGLGWILSEEGFLSGLSLINYLKLRANWALVNTDENLNNYNLGFNYYVSSTSYSYKDGGYSNSSRIMYTGNSNIGWEKVSNINLGFESILLNYKLKVDASYFYNKNFDLITRRINSLPNFFGNLPYENFGSQQVQGVELGLNHETQIGDIGLQIGGNFIYSVPKLLIADELKYPDEYRRSVGKPTDAIFGLVALGLFKDQTDVDSHPIQTFGEVKPGDIKYKDLNNDGIIDSNDQEMIGNSNTRFEYGLNLRLKYKTIELFALGTGQTGQDMLFNNEYYWIYGDRKYSEVVWNRWTPANAATATYPRLSSTSNANNFRNSTFWLEENNWFKLHTVQLTYTIPGKEIIGLNELRIFLRGSNLIKFSEIKEKTDLNLRTVPQMRVFSLGLNLMF